MTKESILPSPPKARGPKRPPLFGKTDIGTLFGLLALGPVAWLVPERHWPRFSRLVGPATAPFIAGGPGLAEQIREIAGKQLSQSPEAVADEVKRLYVERQLPYLRAYRPGGWQPLIKVLGLSHIDAALAEKRGIVLWDSPFAFASLVTKIGLWRSGLKVNHLSHPRHGFSSTRFGMRLLNPIQTKIERGYLQERVVLGLDDSSEALGRLSKILAEGGIVSVRGGGTAKRPLWAPFLESKLPLGAGAPLIAHKAGAALLPVFTRRDGAGGFVVRVDAPIDLPASAPRNEAIQAAAVSFAKRMEAEVLKAPGEWSGWAGI